MFREIESCIRRSHLSSKICHSSSSEGNFGIESYGISVTTLEEVFLRVSGQNFDEIDKSVYYASHTGSDTVVSEASHSTLIKPTSSKLSFQVHIKFFIWICYTLGSTCRLIFAPICSLLAFITVKFCCCGLVTRSTFWEHSKALFIKRAISARRDRRTIVFQLLIPAVFLLFGLLFLKLKTHPDQYSMTLTTSYFNPLLRGGGGGPIPFNLSLPIAKKVCFAKERKPYFLYSSSLFILVRYIDCFQYIVLCVHACLCERYGFIITKIS